MTLLKPDELNKKFDYVLCDSIEALNFCYNKGLNKKIKVVTNSPSILLEKKIKSVSIDRKWSEKKIFKFQKSILPFSLKIFNSIKKTKKFEIELAILSAILGNQLSNFLLKLSFIDKSLLNKKILFVKLNDKLKGANNINPPWTVISKKLKFHIFSYTPKNYSSTIPSNNILPKISKRIYVGGLETLFLRLILKYKLKNIFKRKKNIFLINENEMIIEITSKLFFSGFNISNLKNVEQIKRKNKYNTNTIKELQNILHQIFERKIKKSVLPELCDECLAYFNKQLKQNLEDYFNWKTTFKEKITYYRKKNKGLLNKSIVFINHPSSPKGLAVKNIFNSNNIQVFSFQHGVTAEISDSHDYCLSQHDSSSSDVYVSFNKGSYNIAKSNPFNQSIKQYIYGAPKRYKRTNSIFYKKKFDILYISNNLFMGNIGGVYSWCSDFTKAKIEIEIIKILESINKKVFFKPYPEFNKRYYESNPCLNELKNKNNIEIIKNNYDARYFLNNFKLLICGIASSTTSWAVMSDIPTVFINYKNIAPLNQDAYNIFKKGLFLFDYDDKNFFSDITSFLNKDLEEIKKIWQSKKTHRNKLKENFISSSKGYSLNEIFN
ncbi:MAG: hypothetical protein CBB97_25405 [Candidatus Endolissoclinum sp. TMED37]|nr:MAG: hypothetical protein CBB97_25405 [Candidatus Endolissoclinum sp. TMED37]